MAVDALERKGRRLMGRKVVTFAEDDQNDPASECKKRASWSSRTNVLR